MTSSPRPNHSNQTPSPSVKGGPPQARTRNRRHVVSASCPLGPQQRRPGDCAREVLNPKGHQKKQKQQKQRQPQGQLQTSVDACKLCRREVPGAKRHDAKQLQADFELVLICPHRWHVPFFSSLILMRRDASRKPQRLCAAETLPHTTTTVLVTRPPRQKLTLTTIRLTPVTRSRRTTQCLWRLGKSPARFGLASTMFTCERPGGDPAIFRQVSPGRPRLSFDVVPPSQCFSIEALVDCQLKTAMCYAFSLNLLSAGRHGPSLLRRQLERELFTSMSQIARCPNRKRKAHGRRRFFIFGGRCRRTSRSCLSNPPRRQRLCLGCGRRGLEPLSLSV